VRNVIGLVFGALLLAGLVRAESAQEQGRVLDSFHQAAATADLADYLALLTQEMVFLGTDGSERWQGQEFRDFVSDNFSAGRGWQYSSVQRRITVSPDARTAWFDETLHNDALGQCRGSGVMLKTSEGWKIAQYNLSVPVPNAMVQQVVADIAVLEGKPAPAAILAVEPANQQAPVAAAAETPAAEAAVDPKPAGDCLRKRHKTNRKAGC
jgi:hypothetical protein